MGWNSWDCFGTAVTEEQVKANADYMADKLARFGWQYIVVDIQWYEPNARGHGYRDNAALVMDRYGRLLPAPNRFPSADGGNGFKSLADYVHSKGLKFGLHALRGIPRQAVEQNTPILGSAARAADIADRSHTCRWNSDMWGIDTAKTGAQEYYDSVFRQFADWGVDFVKVDDFSAPYHASEIGAIRTAIDRTGRPIVLSTSPGETPLDDAGHIAAHANMWRISDDFWDDWRLLKPQFARCRDWARYTGAGHYPDADMLPLGALRVAKHGWTHFTREEQYTLMTLWSISRSPLMFGGNLPANDDFTFSLITNAEVLAVDQHSENGRELWNHDGLIVWVADAPQSTDKYVAVFNTRDGGNASDAPDAEVLIDLADLGVNGACHVRDLWAHQNLADVTKHFSPRVAFHGAGLFRLSPAL